ncbi:hypothetical protein Pelo_4335 [Pelomyxa schiedti]|nr:hypothetical protein Pelo_4335 [Pelomyxa schiedti]
MQSFSLDDPETCVFALALKYLECLEEVPSDVYMKFTRDIAHALMISPNRVYLLLVRLLSDCSNKRDVVSVVLVEYGVILSDDLTADQLVTEMGELVDNTTSALYDGEVTANTVPESLVVVYEPLPPSSSITSTIQILSSSDEGDSGVPGWVWALICTVGIALAIALGTALAVVLGKRREKKEEDIELEENHVLGGYSSEDTRV